MTQEFLLFAVNLPSIDKAHRSFACGGEIAQEQSETVPI